MFQHTAARRRLDVQKLAFHRSMIVSTHSRPKAAGLGLELSLELSLVVSTHSRPKAAGFLLFFAGFCNQGFNTQPPEGGWHFFRQMPIFPVWFQHTAARRRLAPIRFSIAIAKRSFNTQPPEGGWKGIPLNLSKFSVSTHSRPKAAGVARSVNSLQVERFQHTAARRRLGKIFCASSITTTVSTHSRPKAAG